MAVVRFLPPIASEPAADADPLSGVTGLLAQKHQHSRTSTPPMSLAELETAALAKNPEIRAAARRVAIAATRVRNAGSLSDPEFMYRGGAHHSPSPHRPNWHHHPVDIRRFRLLTASAPRIVRVNFFSRRYLRSAVCSPDRLTCTQTHEST
jgi:hypothetical protein